MLNAMAGAYPITKPAKAAAALTSESLRRKINSPHNAPVNGIASSRHQMLTPDARPKKTKVFRFGSGADSIDAKSIVRTGIDKKYHE